MSTADDSCEFCEHRHDGDDAGLVPPDPLCPVHGPELEFTESELRAALEEHSPRPQECDMCGSHILCDCDFKTEWSTDHLIEVLKSARTSR